MSNFFEIFTCGYNKKFSVMVEDDGRVAYAYLLKDEDTIVGDVWLYNQLKTPPKTEWIESEMPFLNSFEFIDNKSVAPIQDASEVEVNWQPLDENKSIEAQVFIRGELVAILRPNEFPGWSLFVKKDGPLAKKY